jgi:hypothetical protein
MSTIIRVQLDAVAALAAELGTLAGELEDQTRTCGWAASSLCAALPGADGLTAGAAADTWASLLGALAQRTAAVSAVLVASVAAYRAEDDALAGRIPTPRIPTPRRDPAGAGW